MSASARYGAGEGDRSFMGRTAILVKPPAGATGRAENFTQAINPTTTASIAASEMTAAGRHVEAFGLRSPTSVEG